MNRIILITAMLLASIGVTFAESTATITVHVTDKDFATEQLTLILQQEYIYNGVGAKEVNAKADRSGNFRFKFNIAGTYNKFTLQFADFPFLFNYIEPGDDLHISYSARRADIGASQKLYTFSGKGSEKLQLFNALVFSVRAPKFMIAPARHYNKNNLDSLLLTADTNYLTRKRILQSYSKSLSRDMAQIYGAEIFIGSYLPVLRYFDFERSKGSLDSAGVTYLLAELEKREPRIMSRIAADYPDFLRYTLKKSAFYASYRPGANKKTAYALTYEDLIRRNKGELREKAVLFFVLGDTRFRHSDNTEEIYDSGMKFMTNASHRAYVESVKANRKVGAKAFDFSMTGINGETVRLHDFKQKVVLIEGWFTGCEPCIGLAKTIKSTVLPQFIGNPDVVFLTVNVDQLKSRWLRSIETGDYTNSKSINLWTDGLAMNHPFLKYYRFQALPQLLLVARDGTLISADIRGTGEDIIKKIKHALVKQ